jgi:hypothetical protein
MDSFTLHIHEIRKKAEIMNLLVMQFFSVSVFLFWVKNNPLGIFFSHAFNLCDIGCMPRIECLFTTDAIYSEGTPSVSFYSARHNDSARLRSVNETEESHVMLPKVLL